ncbi:MAG: mannose-1-phosphate guanylyltransferase [Caldimonas sp.]|uniref:N-acetylmuramate alpha-1-phosphate uridylyltransferase MurU n=1 Tax=Caldimonas taiwanensis TaxID=307483 RepID=UPI000783B0B6|nr:nucleotidyltransferase family protein [Caldimonas taiwanensis]GIX24841.1 MAG: mannose-1-phosphate guanylyltransferase [Caldimonas sp.]
MDNLKALILAAGRGERMRPLTDHTPKPLLPVHGRPLIEWHLLALARDGVREVVINTAWLEAQFPATLGDGSRFGLRIHYSMEGRDHGGALETAGGIAKALPWLGECFWVVSGDIFAPDFRFDAARAQAFAAGSRLAHLWLVPNPPYHPRGDFGIGADGLGLSEPPQTVPRHTYANLALMRAELCRHLPVGRPAALGPLLHEAMRRRQISVEMYTGRWENVGTPAQWEALSAPLPFGTAPPPEDRT